MTQCNGSYTVFEPDDVQRRDPIVALGHGHPPLAGFRNVEVVAVDALLTDDAVEKLRASLWSTWGAGRQTTDWPSHGHLREALAAALPGK